MGLFEYGSDSPRYYPREEIYELVWSKPISDAAKQLETSVTTLRKHCLNHKIPIPDSTFWSRMSSGKTVRRQPLVALNDDRLHTVRITVTDPAWKAVRSNDIQLIVDDEIRECVERESLPKNRISVSKSLSNMHPLTVATQLALESQNHDDDYGRIRSPFESHKGFEVRVSRGNIRRALLLLNTFTLAFLNRQSASVEWCDRRRAVRFCLQGDEFHLRLIEQSPKSERPKKKREDRWERDVNFTPNGMFDLVLQRLGSEIGKWKDQSDRRVEESLNEVIIRMLRTADQYNIYRVRKEKKDRERWRVQEDRLTEVRQKECDGKNVAALWELGARLHHIECLRRLVSQLKTHCNPERLEQTISTELQQWIATAEDYILKMDPQSNLTELPKFLKAEDLRKDFPSDGVIGFWR